MNSKVFVCHASEDKDRFVLEKIVDHILNVLEQKRWIKVSRSSRGYEHVHIYDVSPELERFLRET
jgi:hypothetical protein